MIIGILGIVAVVRKICCLLVIYQIFLIIFFVAFIILGVGGIILPNNVFPNTCNDSSNFLVNQAYSVYKNAQSTLCQNSCQCDITPSAFSQYSPADQAILLTYKINTTSGANLTQGCSSFNTWSSSDQNMAWALQSVE